MNTSKCEFVIRFLNCDDAEKNLSDLRRRGRHSPEHRHSVVVQVATRGQTSENGGVRAAEESGKRREGKVSKHSTNNFLNYSNDSLFYRRLKLGYLN